MAKIKNKVMLTGGMGYIGAHTAVEFIRAGIDVVIADNLVNSSSDMLVGINKITGKEPAFINIDVRNERMLTDLLSADNYDAVVHFAGFKSPAESLEKPIAYYENNLGAAISVIKAMRRAGCNKMIFSSSASVYGQVGSAGGRLKETSNTGACSGAYAWSKLMIERILEDAVNADNELSVISLRYFNPVGAHESGEIGERVIGKPDNLMPYITQVAAGIRDKVTVFGSDYPTRDGTCIRDYVHVTDLACGHLAAYEYIKNVKGAIAVNLGTGNGVTVLELISAFERVNGVKIPYIIGGRRQGDTACCIADADKAYELLGWKSEKTIDDMCRDAWRWEKKLRS